MDSMRSLNTSLPRSPKRTPTQPPEQLLQAFKTAALSVTNLYKTAASNETRARQAGYQDALDDILSFLDKEKLGLGDGEGWKVRRWATERLDGSTTGIAAGSESDDERGETEKRARSSSPVVQDKSNHDTAPPRQSTGSSSPTRVTSAPPPMPPQPPTSVPVPAPEIFSFRSSHAYPQDMDTAPPDSSANQHDIQNMAPIPASAAVRVDVLPRGVKAPHRSSSHPIKHNTRTATSLGRRSLGSGAGSKRRFDFTDYFGLGDLGDGRDGIGGGGGKRGRLS
ncbi:MAG: hypothetical protein Q9216_006574 [Gyalolechia sp. 2 TL-2023]